MRIQAGGERQMAQAVLAPVSARRAQTRERLMQAAAAVFADRGVNGASVEEITEAAHFTRGAFYSNFADKSELVLAMLNRSVGAQFAIAQRVVDDLKASGNRLPEELITRALTALAQADQPARGGLLELELRLHAAREPELHAAYLEFTAATSDRLAALITEALNHLGLELTLPFDHALRLIVAVHQHEQQMAAFADTAIDTGPMRSLLGAITRPAAGPPPGSAAEA